jgi:hypothetical protein
MIRVKHAIVYITVEVLLDMPNKQFELNINPIHHEIGG